MTVARKIIAGILTLIGGLFYLFSLSAYYSLAAEETTHPLGAALAAGIGFIAAFIGSVLLVVAALVSGSKRFRVAMILPWTVAFILVLYLAYDLARVEVVTGQRETEVEFRFGTFAGATFFFMLPYLPLLITGLWYHFKK